MRGALACFVVALPSCATPDVSTPASAFIDSAAAPPAEVKVAAPTHTGANAESRPTPSGELPEGSVVPTSVAARSSERAPFLLVLHGYGGRGASFARHFQISRLAEKRGFIYLAPDGEPDANGSRFWNAGPACCNFDGRDVDHVQRLGALLEQARTSTRVDPSRVYVLGYSNGGFMAHRLGCDVAGIRGILSVAGAGVSDASTCTHTPEIVIEVHGDADVTVPFDGGHVLSRKDVPAHPGALATVIDWAKQKGCTAAPRVTGTLDLEAGLPESETERLNFSCAENVTLLKVRGAGHSLATSSPAIDALMDELMR